MCPTSRARRSQDLSPLHFEGRGSHSPFYHSSQFHVDHRRTLKVNEGVSVSFGTLLTPHVLLGTQWMEGVGEMDQMPLPETPCFILVQVPPHSSGNNTAFFFSTGAETGDSSHLKITGILKSQDVSIDIGLLSVTCVSSYLSMS